MDDPARGNSASRDAIWALGQSLLLPDGTLNGITPDGADDGGGQPALAGSAPAADPTMIVFVDPAFADTAIPSDAPGITTIVLDPGRDGIQQIADYLAGQSYANLAAIGIAAPGQHGNVTFGDSVLSIDNIGQYTKPLAEIGAAVQPGGQLILQGSAVASDPNGRDLLAQIARATGIRVGVPAVGAATGDQGSTTPGMSPADASPADASAASAVDPQIWAAVNAAPNPLNFIVNALDPGTGTATNTATLATSITSQFTEIDDVALAPAVEDYFVLEAHGGGDEKIIRGNLKNALAGSNPSYTTIFTDTNTLHGLTPNIGVDVANQWVYFVNQVVTSTTSGFSTAIVFEKVKFDGSQTLGLATLSTHLSTAGFQHFTLDLAHSRAYFTYMQSYSLSAPGAGFNHTGSDAIYVATGLKPNATSVTLTSLPLTGFPSTTALINSIAIDPIHQILYFTTDTNSTVHAPGVFAYALTNNPTGTFTTVFTEAGMTQDALHPWGNPADILVDPISGKYYLSEYQVSSGTDESGIFIGSLSGGTPTLFLSEHPTISTTEAGPAGLAIDYTPTLAATQPAVSYSEGAAAVIVDSGVAVTDPATSLYPTTGFDLASATVSIAGFVSGDTLGASTAGTAIILSYNAATGVLTLTGPDTPAHFQSVLDSVAFSTTSDTTLSTRTIVYTVNDGAQTASATDTVTVVPVAEAPTFTGTTTFSGSDETTIALSGITVSAKDGDDALGATATISGISTGWTLFDGTTVLTAIGGVATLARTDLGALRIVPPDAGASATDSLTLTVTSSEGSSTATGTEVLLVTASVGTPEAPSFSGTTAFSGSNEGAIALSGITVTPGDGDDALGATATISGISSGWTLFDGTTALVATGGVATLARTDLGALKIVAPDIAAAASDSLTLTISSIEGSSTTSAVETLVVTATAVAEPPVFSGTTTFSGSEEGTIALSGITVTPGDSDGTLGATATISGVSTGWTVFDGTTALTATSGVVTVATTAIGALHIVAPDASATDSLTLTVTSIEGSSTASAVEALVVTVADAPLTAGTVSPSPGVEGGAAATLSATFSDANTGAPASDFSGTVNWGDGTTTTFTSAAVSANGGGSFTVSGLQHVYAEDGSYSTTVTINDVGGSSTSETGTATVADAALTAGTASFNGSVEEGRAALLSATFRDANTGALPGDFSGTINWGDGATTPFTSVFVSGGNGFYTVSGLPHVYAESGSYSMTVTINDVGGSSTSVTGTATVADAPLTAGTVSVSGGIEPQTPATLSATFSDANPGAPTSDFSGTINWGDGTAATPFTGAAVSALGGGSFSVSGLQHVYAEDGNYTTTVTINDVDGASTTETGTATVADAPLTAGTVSVSGSVEGVTAATLSATFSDANTGALASDFEGTVNWGDGTTTLFNAASVSALGGGAFSVHGLQHVYAEAGSYSATVTINDVGGSSTTEGGTATVADAALTAGTVSPGTGVEGVTAATLSATFSDANTGALASDFSGTVNWGDGTTTTFTSAAVSALGGGSFSVSGLQHLYAEEGSYSTTVTINDVGGSSTSESGTATVADAPLTAGTVSPGTGVEGITAATLSATFSDANAGAPTSDFSGTVNWGDGTTTTFTSAAVSALGGGTFSVSGLQHVYAEDGSYSTTVTINDVGGSSTTESGTATVADAALTAGTVSPGTGVEAVTAATLSATFSDANTGASASDFSGTVNWGDGTTTAFNSAAVSALGGGAFSVSGLQHVYAEEGSYSTTVTINDVGGSSTTESGTATVADAALTAGTVSVIGGVEGGTPATLSATFSDADTGALASDFSGTVNWGDGTTTTFTSAAVSATGPGSFSVSGLQHVYAEDGNYSTTLTINDVGGSSTTETGTASVTAVAEAPTFGGPIAFTGSEEGTIALPGITVTPGDSDDALGATATISGISLGWTVFDGTTALSATSGVVTLATSDLGALQIVAPDAGASASDSLTLTVTSSEGSSTASAVETLVVTATAVAEPPTLTTTDTTAPVGVTSIALTIVDRAADGDDTLGLVTIAGVPTGFSLNEGTDLGGGTWSENPAGLGSLALIAPSNDSATLFSLSVTAISTEGSQSATTTAVLQVDIVPCFCRGTLILADRGEVAVEDLAIGDKVVTLSGEAKPIKWIGRRAFESRFVAGNRSILPIRIEAAALADGVPGRDLFVSPEHALYLDGLFLPARLLVNGTTIRQAESVDRLEYFHIELEAHDIIFAEGAAAETFIDVAGRAVFHNGAEFAALYPDAGPADSQSYWALLDRGAAGLPGVRSALLARAAELGRVSGDPDLHLIVDGAIVRAQSVAGHTHRFTVPADARRVTIASRSVVPVESEAASLDDRRLGVPIERVVLSGTGIRIEIGEAGPALRDGFHHDEGTHRWSDGRGLLPPGLLAGLLDGFADRVTVEVVIAATGLHYPADTPPPEQGSPRMTDWTKPDAEKTTG